MNKLFSPASVILATFFAALNSIAEPAELWRHLPPDIHPDRVRNLAAEIDNSGQQRVLRLDVIPSGETSAKGISWISIPPPAGGWDLNLSGAVDVLVKNTGLKPAEVTLWVVSTNGWDAVGAAATPLPGKSAVLSCQLRETYPDGTPKIDPGQISEIRIMIQKATTGSFEFSNLVASGKAEPWIRPPGRLEVPNMETGQPAAGKRIRYRLPGDETANIYCAIYFPPDWTPQGRYPLIAEFPGNIFYRAAACYSTGRPEQCVIGYGVTSGAGSIWVSLPFVDLSVGAIAESGFGSQQGEDTAAYALKVINHICENLGGDRENIVLSGFSRGSIACGYIGLRNDKIAALWQGFIGCQHYDGSKWRQSNMADAVVRAPRFRGKAIFQIDNSRDKYGPVEEATLPEVKWTWEKSGLGYHATAMFLDDRPMMQNLRKWYADLTTE
ncbi:MAG: hypothetical protein P1V20_02700 [Verrucomicrobiales bacterium]|nr:hypothetical protein [Verrucomicrobiales bacterium]